MRIEGTVAIKHSHSAKDHTGLLNFMYNIIFIYFYWVKYDQKCFCFVRFTPVLYLMQ